MDKAGPDPTDALTLGTTHFFQPEKHHVDFWYDPAQVKGAGSGPTPPTGLLI